MVLPGTLADTVFGAGGVALSGLPLQATYLEILEEYYYFYMRRCLYRAVVCHIHRWCIHAKIVCTKNEKWRFVWRCNRWNWSKADTLGVE